MDKGYGTMFKRLMHERNELRKYIIDICKLLDIDTRQSILGANCLGFYAVLSSVAKDKINYMEGYIRTVENARDEFAQELKRKEEECEELKRKCDENKAVISQLQQWQDEDLRQIAELKKIKDDFFKQAEISHEAVLNKNKIIEKLEKEGNKYKQVLDEIKKIAEENIRIADLEGLNGVYRRGSAEQILQKISECEVHND